MTKPELSKAMELAQSDEEIGLLDTDIFHGFGLPDFKQVFCTTLQLAQLIRWQCFQMNGGIDSEALQEIANMGRKRFMVVGN